MGDVLVRLIDADALQRKICGAKCGCEYEDCGNDGDCEFANFIFWAPTIDSEPVRHGKWIRVNCEFSQCSLCKYPVHYSWCESRYCPNCGAKMDGE